MPAPVRIITIDDDGVTLRGRADLPLDVHFDGQRVWSFWSTRDTEKAGRFGVRRVEWPSGLQKFLDGSTRIVVREHVDSTVLFDEERSFGDSPERIRVVNARGAPLGTDKSGKLVPTFESRTSEHLQPLLDAVERLCAEIRDAGVEAFAGYGTLLGAVREQKLLGHDSDADLCYVSRYTRPVDVVLESFRLQRALVEKGFQIRRYSGAAFKVNVVESDGVARGLDVFGGYIDPDDPAGSKLYLMGEVGHPFQKEWIFPLGTCTLEGRTLPAPARPEHLLEAMYGKGWRVPDPAFQFETPSRVIRQLDGWFRGTRPNRGFWDRRYSNVRGRLPEQLDGTRAARTAVKWEGGVPEQVIDLGCGRGGDMLWFARQGARVVGYDYATAGSDAVRRTAEKEGLDLQVIPMNFNEWRWVLGEGARVANQPGPRTVLARFTLESLTPFGRDSMVRFASMVLRDGGRMILEVWLGGGRAPSAMLTPMGKERVERLLTRHGARIVDAKVNEVEAGANAGTRVGRWVVQWAD